MREKQKNAAYNYIRLVGRYALIVAKLILSHSHANKPRTRPRKRNW